MSGKTERLAGRTALVTGGARRIGRALTLALARAGANVVVHCRSSTDEARETVAEARAAGVEAWTAEADLARAGTLDAFMDSVLERTGGRLDLLVNNASAYGESRLATLSARELEESVRLHVFAPLALARRFAALDRSGDIVNILDARITACDARHAAYHLGKRMLFTLTRMLALELAPRIRVNALAPGAVLPPDGLGAGELERLAAFNPLRAHGTPEGLAECLLFLLRADFVTGQVIFYDGGYHLKAATYG
jgi:pteridine reductase